MSETSLILHIEDDSALATAVKIGLKDAGFKVVRAMNGEEGLRQVRIVRPNLIILDLGMPGMSGGMVLRQLSSMEGANKIPVLVFTAYAGMMAPDLKQRVAGFLLKPVHIETLVNEIRRILATGVSGDGAAAKPSAAEQEAGASQ